MSSLITVLKACADKKKPMQASDKKGKKPEDMYTEDTTEDADKAKKNMKKSSFVMAGDERRAQVAALFQPKP